jgi:hypothetical protein
MEMNMFLFLIRMLELFGVVFLRFRPVPRLWCVWLVGVNLACLWFITQIEGQVVLAVTAIAVAGQTVIYQRIGFTRILDCRGHNRCCSLPARRAGAPLPLEPRGSGLMPCWFHASP